VREHSPEKFNRGSMMEKFAVKALRGDFAGIDQQRDPNQRARAAWQAANA
jgi:hypothetical protein